MQQKVSGTYKKVKYLITISKRGAYCTLPEHPEFDFGILETQSLKEATKFIKKEIVKLKKASIL